MDWKFALFSFSGRLNRARYWMAAIAVAVVYAVIAFLDTGVIHGPGIPIGDPSLGMQIGFLTMLAYVFLLFTGVALGIKRLHDRDRSGWFYLLLLVPLVNIWIAIEILFLRGTVGPNRFGPDPLGPTATTNYPMAA